MRVLLTGGAGYIGSHTALVLLEQGHDVVVVDDEDRGLCTLRGMLELAVHTSWAQETLARAASGEASSTGSF